jgi:hypothetical protein
MLGLDRLKYRSEVIVQIHAILKLMPALTQLLENLPNLKEYDQRVAQTEDAPRGSCLFTQRDCH